MLVQDSYCQDLKLNTTKFSSRANFYGTGFQYVCRHDKDMDKSLAQMEKCEEGGDCGPSPCMSLKSIHQFIQKRFRRLLARNFSSANENGHVLFYKISHSNAFSDVSGVGMIKCSSDLEDNLDSCSIVADSLCSVDDHVPSVLHISDNEINEKSPAPRSTTNTVMTQLDSVMNDEQQSAYSMATPSSCCAAAPLFCYLTCRVQLQPGFGGAGGDGTSGEAFIPLVDMPTCYRKRERFSQDNCDENGLNIGWVAYFYCVFLTR